MPIYKSDRSHEDFRKLRNDLDIKSISMSRSGCFGFCPVYNLKFSLDGTAEYHGKSYVDHEGKFTGKINLLEYGRLCYLIEVMDFKKLNPRYQASMTDLSSVTVTVNYKNGRTKEVHDYGNRAPIKFWGLTKTIDAIKDDIEWKKKN